MNEGEESYSFNVGGRLFSIPLNRLAGFQDSVLLGPAGLHEHKSTVFIDRDCGAFRHVHYYINTGELASACAPEMNILHELAAGLHLTALQQALENPSETTCLKIPYSEPEPEHLGRKVMPQGLVSAPLVAGKEEVLYCFILLQHTCLRPGLITRHNLLWLCEDVAIIECSSHLFRFIANFLQSGTILLPELFSEYGELFDKARMVGMTDFTEMLQELSDWEDTSSLSDSCSEGQMCCEVQPFYTLSLSLLVKYPDSLLGQLSVESNLEGSRLYITGTGVLFQHVENWLGTSRLPLTRTAEELPCLCAYLDNQDELYLAIREAMRELFHRMETSSMSAVSGSASVSTFTLYKVIKVYAGTHWYATYLKTLIKHPELLSNSTKSNWIVFGESLLVKGDGQMFRHILNFLRCGRLLLPGDFSEWPLLCQEIEAFQIPALSRALQNSSDYRAWCKARGQLGDRFTSCKDKDIFNSSLDCEESKDERGSPENTVLSRVPAKTCSEMETGRVSVGASKITEVQPAASERTKRTENLSLTSPLYDSPPAPAASTSSYAHEELMIENSRELPPEITACSRSQGVSEDYWTRQMASILHMLQESRQTEDSSVLEHVALLMETSALSKSRLTRMLAELSDTEKSALTVTLVTAFCSNWQSCKEQQHSVTRRERAHTEEHNTHAHRKPSRDQRAWMKRSAFPITSFTLPVGGWVLTVDHPAVLGRGEAGGYFTNSVIYTDEHPQMMQLARQEGNDVAFAYFSMSYEEMVYARECHAFLTGTILDSSGLNLKDHVVQLLHHLWTGHMEVENFVQELLTVIKVRPHKQVEKHEKLSQWVKFTLPLAKRYTECVRELLRKTSLHTVSMFPSDILEVTIPTQKRVKQ